MTPVERLQAAEARLREAADGVGGGGWFTDDVTGLAQALDAGLPLMALREAELHADYIALISPPVALAVADWLGYMAGRYHGAESDLPSTSAGGAAAGVGHGRITGLLRALVVANCILGIQP